MKRAVLVLLFLVCPSLWGTDNCANLPPATTLAPDNLFPTPPMGWDSWYIYNTATTEAQVKSQADALVSTGLLAKGYNLVVIEDGWPSSTRSGGNIVGDPTKFPDGMAAMGSYIHADGEKYGLYTSPYTTTCGGFMGSGTFEAADAATFSSWGVDYLKYDGCQVQLLYPSCFAVSGKQIYQWMAQLSRAQTHQFALTLGCVPNGCPAGTYAGNQAPGYPWSAQEGYDDNRVNYTDYNGSWTTWDHIFNLMASIPNLTGRANYPNVDYLGDGFTTAQQQTQFVMAAMWSAPLVLGIDLTTITAAELNIYGNTAVIAVDQDSAVLPATRVQAAVSGDAPQEVWVKPLHDGTWAIAMVNRASTSQTITFSLVNYGVNPDVRDLLAGTDLGNHTSLSATLAGYSSAMYKVVPAARANPVAVPVL